MAYLPVMRRILLGLAFLGAASLGAQGRPAPPLSFLGIPAGAPLPLVARQVDSLGGTKLRCDRSRTDPAVLECRGVLTDPEAGFPVELWLSAIDSTAGVLTLSGRLDGVSFDRWRESLIGRYGKVDARVQGTQWMLQWVRQGRMLRLTWRIEGTSKVTSVSLIDGRVLDGWGRARAADQAARAEREASSTPVEASSP
jgi:hypothetical protein